MDISPGYTLLNPTVLFPRSVQVQEQNDRFHTVWRDWTNMCNQTLAASFQGQFRPLTMESTGGTLKQTRMYSAQTQSLWAHYSFPLHWQQPPSPSQEQTGICVLSSEPKKSYKQQKMPFPFGTSHELFSPSRSRHTSNLVQNQTHRVSNTKWNVSTTLSRNHLASTVTIT